MSRYDRGLNTRMSGRDRTARSRFLISWSAMARVIRMSMGIAPIQYSQRTPFIHYIKVFSDVKHRFPAVHLTRGQLKIIHNRLRSKAIWTSNAFDALWHDSCNVLYNWVRSAWRRQSDRHVTGGFYHV